MTIDRLINGIWAFSAKFGHDNVGGSASLPQKPFSVTKTEGAPSFSVSYAENPDRETLFVKYRRASVERDQLSFDKGAVAKATIGCCIIDDKDFLGIQYRE